MSSTCPICFDDLTDKFKASPDTCDHIFCLYCLEKWSKLGSYCPVDRKRFKKIINLQSDDAIDVKPRKRKRTRIFYDFSTTCEICNKDESPDTLLLCDCCDLGFHCLCLSPSLNTIPAGLWFCPTCVHVEEKLRNRKGIQKKEVETDLFSTNIKQNDINSKAPNSLHSKNSESLYLNKPESFTDTCNEIISVFESIDVKNEQKKYIPATSINLKNFDNDFSEKILKSFNFSPETRAPEHNGLKKNTKTYISKVSSFNSLKSDYDKTVDVYKHMQVFNSKINYKNNASSHLNCFKHPLANNPYNPHFENNGKNLLLPNEPNESENEEEMCFELGQNVKKVDEECKLNNSKLCEFKSNFSKETFKKENCFYSYERKKSKEKIGDLNLQTFQTDSVSKSFALENNCQENIAIQTNCLIEDYEPKSVSKVSVEHDGILFSSNFDTENSNEEKMQENFTDYKVNNRKDMVISGNISANDLSSTPCGTRIEHFSKNTSASFFPARLGKCNDSENKSELSDWHRNELTHFDDDFKKSLYAKHCKKDFAAFMNFHNIKRCQICNDFMNSRGNNSMCRICKIIFSYSALISQCSNKSVSDTEEEIEPTTNNSVNVSNEICDTLQKTHSYCYPFTNLKKEKLESYDSSHILSSASANHQLTSLNPLQPLESSQAFSGSSKCFYFSDLKNLSIRKDGSFYLNCFT